MNRSDFTDLIDSNLFSCFPDLKSYVADQEPETKHMWAELFAGSDARDVERAIVDFQTGKVQVPFNRDEWATRLLKVTREHRDFRLDKERSEAHREQIHKQATQRQVAPRDPSDSMGSLLDIRLGHECGDAYREIMRRTDEGEDYESVKADVLGRLRIEWGM